ncbi:biotin--[acetyl-CoA-carboxylase] ligase [Thermofilum pendens]|uniref:Biotin--acetyl-CoA-carboxylase ligase n=1 Tax=Thermofilum pendens (strain DSM 2475 / Hrk 5) TaxID=368408 RepID=A1S0A5_THEPD|nr:biotin--[acetyl-CoA-carboxylase] ligase [Thermofilum pendens]ABL78885.1 biotin--acetyl-CoA-carboxylase ligase [Thermofilum pendens Hrk 5]
MDGKELRRRVLEVLARRGGYVRGGELAEKLGVSKVAIHRAIVGLRKMGYVVESHPRRGYRLVSSDNLADANAVVAGAGRTLRYTAYYVKTCGSTQDVADALASQGAEEGTVVVAESMTSGRGRLGRRWFAGPGGLWFTVILRPQQMKHLQLLSLAAGLSVAKSVRGLYGIDARLKWPNDVVVGERKLCGILVEGKAEADALKYLLLGVGVNVNNEVPEGLEGVATSIKEILGHPVPRLPLLKAILAGLDGYYAALKRGEPGRVVEEWKTLSSTLGRRVRVSIVGGGVVEGVAVDVTSRGELVVQKDTGGRVTVDAGDVEHLR